MQRTLSADPSPLYDHNFPVAVPTACHRSSYFSPFRVYMLGSPTPNPAAGVDFSLQIAAAACPQSGAYCCGQPFDHLLIKTGG